MTPREPAPRAPGAGPAFLSVALLLLAQFAWVRSTNFGGVDEWLYLDLNSRGIVGFPHSNRPLTLLWSLPAVWIVPHGFGGYFVLHATYLALAAGLVFLLGRRLTEDRAVAFLAGSFAATWAPLDMARLATVQTSMNSGVLLLTLLAALLLVVSWEQARPAWLAVACALALAAARSYEAVVALLVGAPLLLLFTRRRPARGGWAWVLGWEATALLALGLAARPLLDHTEGSAYQNGILGLDLAPARYLQRLLDQYALHLRPLVPADPRELLHPGVAGAAALFLAAWWGLGLARPGPGDEAPRRLASLGLLGLVLAGLGYAVLVASPQVQGATRTQFLAGPGIGLLLASALVLAGTLLPPRWRGGAVGLVGATVVAVGTGHTLGMQREWDRISYYGAQVGSLRQLTSQAPAFRANTLLLLTDEAAAWPYTLSFRHAVSYLYGDCVVGHVIGANAFLYALAAEPEGIRSVPAPVVRAAWRTAPRRHRWDEIVLAHLDASGRLAILDEWNGELLPPLPPGARYEPRLRIDAGQPAPPERRVLEGPAFR